MGSDFKTVELDITIGDLTYIVEVPEDSVERTREAMRRADASYQEFDRRNLAAYPDLMRRRVASLVMLALNSELRALDLESKRAELEGALSLIQEVRGEISKFLTHDIDR